MANDYITITTSDDTPYKFRVLLDGYDPALVRKHSADTTIDGVTDFTIGSVKRKWSFRIRARKIAREAGFGSIDDLRALFMLSDPGGSPSTLLTLSDHYGDEFDVFLLGDYHPSNLGVMLEGTEASFVAQVVFQEK